jgi:hypothetical protein
MVPRPSIAVAGSMTRMRTHIAVASALGVTAYVITTGAAWIVDAATRDTSVVHVLAVERAQRAFAGANHGYFAGELKCLSEPQACLRDYSGGPLLPRGMRLSSGQISFVPGNTISSDAAAQLGISPVSTQAFSYWEYPSGGRPWFTRVLPLRPAVAFCVDARLRPCELSGMAVVRSAVQNPECPPTCRDLQ